MENNEHQDKKARIEEKEEPAVVYATPQTLCVVVISEEGTRSYYWNQGGELNDTETKIIGYFLEPEQAIEDNGKWLRSVTFGETFVRLVNKASKLDFSMIYDDVAAYNKFITIDDLKAVVAENNKWESRLSDKDFKQRTKGGRLPLRMVFVDGWC